jgi:hypothetical protein
LPKGQNLKNEVAKRLEGWLSTASWCPSVKKREARDFIAPPPEAAPTELKAQLLAERGGPQPYPGIRGFLKFTEFPVSELFAKEPILNDRGTLTGRWAGGWSGKAPRVGSVAGPTKFLSEVDRIVGVAGTFFMDLNRTEEIFYRLYFHVRSTLLLAILARETWPPQRLPGIEMPSALEAGAPQFIAFDEKGHLSLKTHPVWLQFADAIKGVEPERLKRCEECGAIFYCTRRNTAGCAKHRALLCVKRSQARAKIKKQGE